MSWSSNLRKGTDLPTWDWLSMQPDSLSYHGSTLAYDGFRYYYMINQTGTTTSTANSTTTLWKYDTWTDGWHRIATMTSCGSGGDMVYDPVRNVLIIQNGGTTTTLQCFSLNTSATLANGNTQISGVTFNPYTNTTLTPALTTTNVNGGQMALVEDISTVEPFATGTVTSGTSTTVFNDAISNCLVNAGHIGCAIRFTSGNNSGQRKIISNVTYTKGTPVFTIASGTAATSTITVNNATGISVGMSVTGRGIGYNAEVSSIVGTTITLTVPNTTTVSGTIQFVADIVIITVSSAFTNTPAFGDAYTVEYPQGTAVAGSTSSTLTIATDQTTPNTNTWRDADVIILSGTGAGQRRRIASATGTTLTLAGTTTGNARTGNWTTTPDNTSTYKIVPSSDFVYSTPGNGNTLAYRLDINTNTTAQGSWTAITAPPASFGNGHQLFHGRKLAPFSLFAMRGGSNRQVYRYDIGLQTWTEISPALGSGNAYIGPLETFSTGSHACGLWDFNRIALHVNGTTRLYAMRLTDGFIEPLATLPYAAPASYDGTRMDNVVSLDGVQWLYFQRAGGGEFYRLALEHLP